MIGVSDETAKQLRAMFDAPARFEIAHLLATECADNLKVPSVDRTTLLERIHLSILKLNNGRADEIRTLIDEARRDWRELIRRAGFAESRMSHREWYPSRRATAHRSKGSPDADNH